MAQYCIHSEFSSETKPSRFESNYNYYTFKEAEINGIESKDEVFINSFDDATKIVNDEFDTIPYSEKIFNLLYDKLESAVSVALKKNYDWLYYDAENAKEKLIKNFCSLQPSLVVRYDSDLQTDIAARH